jgi:hypothetical protein
VYCPKAYSPECMEKPLRPGPSGLIPLLDRAPRPSLAILTHSLGPGLSGVSKKLPCRQLGEYR